MKKCELLGAYEVFFRISQDYKKILPFNLAFKIELFLRSIHREISELVKKRDEIIIKYAKYDMENGEIIFDQETGMPVIPSESIDEYNKEMEEFFEQEMDFVLDEDLYFTKEELAPTQLSVIELENILWMIH